MRTLVALLLVLSLVPYATAAGYLVNVGVGSNTIQYGVNPFGGSGDAVDVGVANAQCSDEADVVDVGVLNREGGSACGGEPRCEHGQGFDPLATYLANTLVDPSGEPTAANCTDDGDTLDVSVLSTEGGASYECKEKECNETYAGDAHDATDVTVGGLEYGDEGDGNDVGILDCEYNDEGDATDVGVLNSEWYDRADTFDLGILNTETDDTGDLNGLDLGGGPAGAAVGCAIVHVDFPVGPEGSLLP